MSAIAVDPGAEYKYPRAQRIGDLNVAVDDTASAVDAVTPTEGRCLLLERTSPTVAGTRSSPAG
jgi:hypothetical protein